MKTDTDAGGDLRARVVKLTTDRCSSYESALLSGGAVQSSGTYTIPSDVLAPAPRPTVELFVFSADDEDETVQAAEVVQAIFRDSGVTLGSGEGVYSQFTFYVLVSLEVPLDSGGRVNCFTWSVDPEAGGLRPPYDPASGTQGFGFAAGWTAVP